MTTFGCVLIGRNDNYGGNLNQAAPYVLNSCITTYDEVIFVDYNSRDRTLIEDIEENILHLGKLKVIKVTPEEHKKFTSWHISPQPCSEVLARNIGLRRLTTDFLISTNVDEVNPPRDLIDKYQFELDTFYTVARHGISLSEVQNFGKPVDIKIVRANLLQNTYPQSWPIKMTDFDEWSLIAWCGDLQLAHRDIWYNIKAFEEWQLGAGVHDSYIQRKAKESGYKIKAIYDLPIWHIDHNKKSDYGEACIAESFDCLLKDYPGIKSSDDWGFPEYDFEEFEI